MKTLIKLFLAGMILSTLLFSYPANSSAAPDGVVGVVVYPRNVIRQYPANDTDSDSGPAYRNLNPNPSFAPFVLVVKVVGYYGSGNNYIRLWLGDSDVGSTVQTYNRFAAGATKSLDSTFWLNESGNIAPTGLAWTKITADTFYVMVIGRVGGSDPSSNSLLYRVYWDIGQNGTSSVLTGSATPSGPSTLLTANAQDWFLNWDDTPNPESGDPITSADYVELFDESLYPVTTAPVDGNGYFEMVLPDGSSGSFSAEARSESGTVKRTWITPISQTTSTFDERIFAGKGAPTAIRLADFKANTAQSSMLLVSALLGLLVLGGTGLFFIVRTAEIKRKRE